MEMEHEGTASKLEFWSRKSLPVIIQSEAAECGLASLAMVAGYCMVTTPI